MDANKSVFTIMTPIEDLVTVHESIPVSRIEVIFEKNNFHHLPVLNEHGALVGIISKSDLRMPALLMKEKTGKSWGNLIASDIMTPNPLCVDPDDSIGLVADIFLSNKFHAAPVLEGRNLAGIVTAHDLLAYAFKDALEIREDELLENID